MTTQNNEPMISSYVNYLPAVFQEDAGQDGVSFIGEFLRAFELILSGLDEIDIEGFDEIIDQAPSLFDPLTSKDEFLPWLANWVAFSLQEDWDVDTKRDFIDKAAGLYRIRGTKAGLKAMLGIYSDIDVHFMTKEDIESLKGAGLIDLKYKGEKYKTEGKVIKITKDGMSVRFFDSEKNEETDELFYVDLSKYQIAPVEWLDADVDIEYIIDDEGNNIVQKLEFTLDEEKKPGLIKAIENLGYAVEVDEGSNVWQRGERQDIQILEFNDPFRIKVVKMNEVDGERKPITPQKVEDNTVVGINTMVGEGPPHYFLLKMYLWDVDENILWKKLHGIKAIVDLHKPAHTYYDIQIEIPTLQIKIHSTIGLDTLLGNKEIVTFGDV